MSKKYIKGKDGKMQGSLPSAPNLTNPATLNTLPPVPVGSAEIEVSNKLTIEDRFNEMNRLEKESNATLSEGLAEISKAFENIEAIIRERQERSKVELEEAKKRSEEAAAAAEAARKKYENILAAEANKPLNKLKKFFRL